MRTAVTANMVRPVRRGTIIGKETGGPPLSDADHFSECEACSGWFDMRDLGAVLDHEEPRPIRWKIRHDEMPTTGPGDIAERGRRSAWQWSTPCQIRAHHGAAV
jgi:hypothetical protein